MPKHERVLSVGKFSSNIMSYNGGGQADQDLHAPSTADLLILSKQGLTAA